MPAPRRVSSYIRDGQFDVTAQVDVYIRERW